MGVSHTADTSASAPTISVVLPVYNGERFLAEAIDSILQQTFTDFEFIIVDDGSQSSAADIVSFYQRKDPRVRVHRHARNLGITAARNQGCRMARGTFIAVMDADDISLPSRFEKQVAFLRSHPEIAAVGAWVQRVDADGRLGRVHHYPVEPALLAWSMMFFDSVAHPTLMIRRATLDASAAYSAEYPNVEDYALLIRLCLVSRIANLPEVLVNYRMWSGNTSKRPDHEHQAMRVLRDAVREMGIEISDEQAHALHGLSRDRYPANAADIRVLADLIRALRSYYRKTVGKSRLDTRIIDNDAAVRLWQLATLAPRHSVSLAASLALAATRVRPTSIATFGAKAARHLVRSAQT